LGWGLGFGLGLGSGLGLGLGSGLGLGLGLAEDLEALHETQPERQCEHEGIAIPHGAVRVVLVPQVRGRLVCRAALVSLLRVRARFGFGSGSGSGLGLVS
jgi:hypothetical protein